MREKKQIESKALKEWNLQKREYQRQEEDQQHDYQSILNQIKDSKNKVRKL